MASIYKRKNENGTTVWRAVIRIKGHPTVSKSFERKQEADDWVMETERLIKRGQFNFEATKRQHNYSDLIDRLHAERVFDHQRSFKNIRSQFEYWKNRLGSYALIHITYDLIIQERKHLIDSFEAKGMQANPGTINRYMATLSSTLAYAVEQLRWIHENPCSRLLKLKESAGRDRILNEEEIGRLLAACKESKSPYLYCVVLFALTTGARRGEILGLEWRHVDFQNGNAHLRETKNGRPRSVALTGRVLNELQRLYVLRNPGKTLVFASQTAFGRIDIKKAWMEALRRALIQNYRFHDMRHQFATFAASMGASNLELATAMGHRTLAMLLRYSNLDTQSTKKYSEKISVKLTEAEGGENA
ncbi:MAG: site-specific integrase [Parachlamydiales bacterium]|nr:site-specific integrase [Candidatus Acheromyda pituitae]